jgi:hypothetical protein
VKPGKPAALRGVTVYVPPLVPLVFIVQLVGAVPVTRTGVPVPLKFANVASLVFTPMPGFGVLGVRYKTKVKAWLEFMIVLGLMKEFGMEGVTVIDPF